jgi:hypothetical protein
VDNTLLQLDLCAEEMHNSHPVAVALQGDIQVSLDHGLNNCTDDKAFMRYLETFASNKYLRLCVSSLLKICVKTECSTKRSGVVVFL